MRFPWPKKSEKPTNDFDNFGDFGDFDGFDEFSDYEGWSGEHEPKSEASSDSEFTSEKKAGTGIRKSIAKALIKLDNAAYQPLLNKLDAFQKREKKQEIGKARSHFKNLLESNTYQKIDTWFLTLFAVFGQPLLELISQEAGINTNDASSKAFFDYLQQILLVGFAGDTVINTVAQGSKYWLEVENDNSTIRERKRFLFKADPFINIGAGAGGAANIAIENARIARLARLSKTIRLTKIVKREDSVESQSTGKLMEKFKWLVIDFVIGIAAMEYHELLGLVWIGAKTKKFGNEIVNTINEHYTQALDHIYDIVDKQLADHPELSFLRERFKKAIEENNEIEAMFKIIMEVLVEFRQMVNPVGAELTLDENGNIETKDVDAVVMATDLRNFTNLSETLGIEIFTFLKLNYFFFISEVAISHGGRILNHTGDGLIIYFVDEFEEVEEGGEKVKKKVKDKMKTAIKCAKEIDKFTNSMGPIWSEELAKEYEGYFDPKIAPGKTDIKLTPSDNHLDIEIALQKERAKYHQTGIGLAYLGKESTIKIGDVLSLGQYDQDNFHTQVRGRMRALLEKYRPNFSFDHGGEKSRIGGAGKTINWSARIESKTKVEPGRNCYINSKFLEELLELAEKEKDPELLEILQQFEEIDGIEHLKGIEEKVKIYGLPRAFLEDEGAEATA